MGDIIAPFDLTNYVDIINANPNTESKHWNLPCYTELKANIKEHYSLIQNDKCCYCKMRLRFAAYGEPIEHVVPKSDRPQWMFVPKNLALSCYTCNTKKNADNTLSLSGRTNIDYPTDTNAFLIYHPHFDVWADHIEEYHEYFLKPISDKGRETFIVCELYRINLPLDKAIQKNWEEEPFRIKIIENVLLDFSIDEGTKIQCQNIAAEIIRRALRKVIILKNAGVRI
jgi:uncharacterized protein (TIGR02646 family)